MKDAVKLADCVSPAMTEAEYWIKRCPLSNNIRMTQSKIKTFNRNNINRLAGKNVLYDLAGFSEFTENKALSCVHAYGICVRRSMLWSDINGVEPLTAIYVGEPVIILEEEKEWYKVRCVYYEGWINSEAIALCDRKDWIQSAGYKRIYGCACTDSTFSGYACSDNQNTAGNMCNRPDFVVITGDYITLPHISELSGLRLDMGVILQLAAPDEYCGMYYNYIVKVPSRNADGYLEYITTGIPISEDVNPGYLDYTGANVLRQAFKTLGNVYGWAGSMYSRDCSSLVMDVHRCFGIIMPRDVAGQMLISAVHSCNSEDILKVLRPGDILGFPGHTMIYAGYEKNHYVISATGGKYNSCILSTLCIRRENGMTWLEAVTYGKLPVC